MPFLLYFCGAVYVTSWLPLLDATHVNGITSFVRNDLAEHHAVQIERTPRHNVAHRGAEFGMRITGLHHRRARKSYDNEVRFTSFPKSTLPSLVGSMGSRVAVGLLDLRNDFFYLLC